MLKNSHQGFTAILSLVLTAGIIGSTCFALQGEKDGQLLPLPDMTTIESLSNRRTQPEGESRPVKNTLTNEGYEIALENDRLALWFNEDTASVQITDKRSGYIWGTVGEEAIDLSRRWESLARSLFTIEYYDEENNEKRISLSDPSANFECRTEGNAFICEADFEEQGISLIVSMILESDGLRFSARRSDIHEYGSCLLRGLYFVPFLGSVYADDIPGYMFIPDGPGALIRYSAPANYVSMFNKRIYGADAAIDTLGEANSLMAKRTDDYLVDTPQLSLPVYGVVHGAKQNAYLTIVDQGEEYAYIQAYPAGALTDYNWVTARFEYRNLYTHPTGRDGVGFSVPQEEMNAFDAGIFLRLLSGADADYSGMAVKYREILNEQGVLGQERVDRQIPLRLDIMGAEVKKGIVMTEKTLTTVKQAESMAERLSKDGIPNLTMTYKGWQKGGYSKVKYSQTAMNKGVGTFEEMERLRDFVQGKGGRFYLSVNPTTANEAQIRKAEHAIRTIGQQYAVTIRQNPYILFPDSYFIRPAVMKHTVEKTAKSLSGFQLHFEKTGAWLYSDFTRNENMSRTQAMQLLKDTVSAAGGAAMDSVNGFLLPETREYFDCPMVNSQYLFETDTVPFLQIVLKGHVDLYSTYMNQGAYSQSSILKMAEYGLYPSFLVMNAKNSQLNKTPLEDYCSLSFDSWRETMASAYSQLNQALVHTEGAHITEHSVLAAGLVRVTYDNGVKIYVNYLSHNQEADGITVSAEGIAVSGGAK